MSSQPSSKRSSFRTLLPWSVLVLIGAAGVARGRAAPADGGVVDAGSPDAGPIALADGGTSDAGPKPPQASIVIEEADAKAEPPPPPPVGEERNAIGDYILTHSEDVRDCYTDRVRIKPTLQGKLLAKFQIGPNGRVIGVSVSGINDGPLLICVTAVVRKWEFEKPASGGKLSVVYPFVFKPIAAQ